MIQINSGFCCINMPNAVATMDSAILATGCRMSELRWRVSPEMRMSIVELQLSVSDGRDCVSVFRDFHGAETGMFAGIPYVVDRALSPGRFYLERIVEASVIGEIINLAIPAAYERLVGQKTEQR